MSTINFSIREINFKIVYYGPGLSGKTTNLKQIYEKVPGEAKGELVSLATEDERTLFFDFLPLDLGKVNGFTTRFHLYTVPGQVFYNTSRKIILRGVDGRGGGVYADRPPLALVEELSRILGDFG